MRVRGYAPSRSAQSSQHVEAWRSQVRRWRPIAFCVGGFCCQCCRALLVNAELGSCIYICAAHSYIATHMCGFANASQADLRSSIGVSEGVQSCWSAAVSALWCARGCCSTYYDARANEPDRFMSRVCVFMYGHVHMYAHAGRAARMHVCADGCVRFMPPCAARIHQQRVS